MSWTPGVGVDTSIGLGVGYREPVDLRVSRETGRVCLVVGGHVAEIRLERVHVETIRDQLPAVLADLDQVDADGAACDAAREAGGRAEELAAYLHDQAGAADATGEPERAGALRAAAVALTAAVDAVDAAVDEVRDAALEVDRLAEDARSLLAGGKPPDDEPPAG